jgi:hypothetical protein
MANRYWRAAAGSQGANLFCAGRFQREENSFLAPVRTLGIEALMAGSTTEIQYDGQVSMNSSHFLRSRIRYSSHYTHRLLLCQHVLLPG